MGQTATPLRFAVVGVGHLGRHHARILSARPEVTLAGVVDINAARAEEVAASVGTRALAPESLADAELDAVVIAVPTDVHAAVAVPLLRRGVAALVEKPLARSLDEADALIEAAGAGNAVLAVGHSERFNPAVMAALPHITRPGFVEVHRLGTLPGR